MRKYPCALLALFLLLGCVDDSGTVAAFERERAALASASPELLAAAIMYRLAETPEEQQMGMLLQRVGHRDPLAAATARRVELARREKYIDGLDSQTEAYRQRVTRLTELANALNDKELREAALKECQHFAALADAASAVARAQRDRSIITERFLQAIEAGQSLNPDYNRLAEYDDAAKAGQDRINHLIESEPQVAATFKGTWNRRKHFGGFF